MDRSSGAAMLAGVLAISGLNAQQIRTAPAEGRDRNQPIIFQGESPVAPESPILVLNIPINLQAISELFDYAQAVCDIYISDTDAPNGRRIVATLGSRRIPMDEHSFDGVVSVYVESDSNSYPAVRAEQLHSYECELNLCYFDPANNSNQGLCGRPIAAGESNFGESPLTANPDSPLVRTVSGDLRALKTRPANGKFED